MKSKTKDMVLCAVFAAIICICSVISLPVGVVPVTLGTFGIMLTSGALGIKRGFISTSVFILLGLIGLPVFAGFQGGIGVIASPTGGFITGYICMTFICGLPLRKGKPLSSVAMSTLLNILAVLVCYICGIVHFIMITGLSLRTALVTCVAPFVIFDLLKAIGGAMMAESIKKHI